MKLMRKTELEQKFATWMRETTL